MIGKVAASGSGFRGVVNYLLLGKKDVPNPDRVAWTMAHNLLIDDPDRAPALMRATANQSLRCKKPVYHLAIAWHADENPDDDMMREVGAQTLKDLALDEHQALLIAHKDTAHKHLHIIINRVHPETGKAWSNSNDYKRIEISLRKQAEARGLPYVPGRFNDPERFAGKGRGARNGEYQAAVRNGKPAPKAMWSRDDIKGLRAVLSPTFAEATSWDDLSRRVAALGFRLSPKGQGLIIEGADGFMKLSDLGKQVRVKSLEDSYGEPYAAFAGRAELLPDEALKSGTGIVQDAQKNLQTPSQLPRSQKGRNALQSPGADDNGDGDAFNDTVRDAARRAWTDRRLAQPPKVKPASGGNDDEVPGGLPHPDAGPKQTAYRRVRAARADLAKARRDALDGKADAQKLIDAQLELDTARRDLEDLLAEAIDKQAPAVRPERPVPAPEPRDEQRRPKVGAPARTSPGLSGTAAAARGEAFGALRAARQAQDMAQALFNAGVITEEELKAASDDVKRAAETLRPHLSFEEQLQNDIADALRGKPRKHTPKKGGPSR
jgi:hypothetical protein